ncbi:hypothetical protein J6590_080908 [Homalodisca vitripennis]|nr:hypothetical protein J6590_080908 [Homalodisca vitripennis]
MFGLRTIKWSKRRFSIQYQRNTLTQELEQMFGSSPRTGVEDERHVEDICVGTIRIRDILGGYSEDVWVEDDQVVEETIFYTVSKKYIDPRAGADVWIKPKDGS